jgi:hypothetical protein
MNYYLNVLSNFSNFSGRARRKEYWMFILMNGIFSILAAVLDHLLGSTFNFTFMGVQQTFPYGYIFIAYSLFILIPNLAVTVRRLHDTGKSGWFILIGLIPLIGGIWLLVLFLTDSKPGDNQYGVNPKGINFNN